ncbi:MAG: hypothetical protein ACI9W4_001444 [Rhodothermales bacterium]|jgi:hypothetical protein
MLRLSGCLLILAIGFVPACAPSGPQYSLSAEREITRLKSRTLRLMESAERPFSDSASAVGKLETDLLAARTNASTRSRNTASVAQWELLLGTDMLGGFLGRWRSENTLGPTFIVESVDLIGSAFDEMRDHEQRKPGAPR